MRLKWETGKQIPPYGRNDKGVGGRNDKGVGGRNDKRVGGGNDKGGWWSE